VPISGTGRDPQNVSRLISRQSGEEAKFHELGFEWIFGGEFFEGFIQRQQLFVAHGGGDIQKWNPLVIASPFLRMFGAGSINQDPPHCRGGGGKKMTAVSVRAGCATAH
jgi:hypothetical protein